MLYIYTILRIVNICLVITDVVIILHPDYVNLGSRSPQIHSDGNVKTSVFLSPIVQAQQQQHALAH